MADNDRIIRERERARLTGVSRTGWWQAERTGRAPRRLRLGLGSVGWRLSDLERWMKSLPEGGPEAPAAATAARAGAAK